MRNCLAVFAFMLGALGVASPARADSLQRYLDVRCAEDIRLFSVREGATWMFDGPFEEGLIPIDAPIEGGGNVIARCSFLAFEGVNVTFEVRRTSLRGAGNGMCQGIADAEFEIALNGIVLSRWPSDYEQCVRNDYNPPRLARSVSFDSARVEVCTPVSLDGDWWLDRRVLTLRCRAERIEDVLRQGAFPAE